MQVKNEILERIKNGELLKLDLGSGNKYKEGFIRLDKAKEVDPDILCDIDLDDIPLPDDCVQEIEAIAILEHCKNVIHVINEMHRICANGAKIHICVPHPSSDAQFQDPTHKSFFNENSATYWDKRSIHYTNTNYGVKSMFSVVEIGFEVDPVIGTMGPDEQKFALKHFRNIITRIHFKLTVEKNE